MARGAFSLAVAGVTVDRFKMGHPANREFEGGASIVRKASERNFLSGSIFSRDVYCD
jgi:hypothetical protein